MALSYDDLTRAFLSKVAEYDFAQMLSEDREEIVDGYMKSAVAHFSRITRLPIAPTANDYVREYEYELEEDVYEETVEIISTGMVVQWLTPFLYTQDLLERSLNTNDFTQYSPAELLKQIKSTRADASKEFRNSCKDLSYSLGDLTELHM